MQLSYLNNLEAKIIVVVVFKSTTEKPGKNAVGTCVN